MDEPSAEIRISADIDKLPLLFGFVGDYSEASGCGSARKNGLLLAAEEAFVNICRYSYPKSHGEVTVSCCRENNFFILEFVDEGIPFDILAAPEPDLDPGIEQRSPGGLGIHFIRQLSDRLFYKRDNGRNILTMAFNCGHGTG
jgi:anti-sigma regulatory factor (Ser/Thr protein kinase)